MGNDTKKLTGSVIFFNPKKGYGFIKRDDCGADIFVFYTDISMPGFKVLYTDDVVEFTEDYSFKDRIKAANVVILEQSAKHKQAELKARERKDKENV